MKATKLKKLAEAATPGRWQAHHDRGMLVVESDNGDLYIKIEKGSAAQKHMANAAYIAATNPAAILKLLQINAELVDALKGFVERQMTVGQRYTNEVQAMLDALAKAEGGEL